MIKYSLNDNGTLPHNRHRARLNVAVVTLAGIITIRRNLEPTLKRTGRGEGGWRNIKNNREN